MFKNLYYGIIYNVKNSPINTLNIHHKEQLNTLILPYHVLLFIIQLLESELGVHYCFGNINDILLSEKRHCGKVYVV